MNHTRLETQKEVLDVRNADGDHTQVLHNLGREIIRPAVECKIFCTPQFIELYELSYYSTDNPENVSWGCAFRSPSWVLHQAYYEIPDKDNLSPTMNMHVPHNICRKHDQSYLGDDIHSPVVDPQGYLGATTN